MKNKKKEKKRKGWEDLFIENDLASITITYRGIQPPYFLLTLPFPTHQLLPQKLPVP